MKITITNRQSTGSRMNWEHGEHSGNITFPDEERGLIYIDWDGDCPDDWEDIEACIEEAVIEGLNP